MPYGYFDDHNKEYVITNPRTPLKWINYVGDMAFGGFVDHTGGALICKGDPALNRITKYMPQVPASDFRGQTLYLRYKQGNRYRVFSPYFVPTLDPFDLYECHIGLGYTRIVSEFYGIRTEATIFVPPDGIQLLQDICITNLSGAPLEIDAIPVVEYTHFDALAQLTNADWVPQTMQSRAYWEANGLLVLIQYPFMFKDVRINYFTSNRPVSSFESDRRNFLGDNEYGTWADPRSLQGDELSNFEAPRGNNIAALLHHLGVLRPGETAGLVTQLGQEANLEQVHPVIERYRDTRNVERAFRELAEYWDAYLARFQVETPDVAMDTMLNIHNPRQCYITKNWSRELSLYQWGFGDRGIGFRDSFQDAMGILTHMPQEGRALAQRLLQAQRRDGSAMHQFSPSTLEASMGHLDKVKDRPRFFCDDQLWAVLAITAYLKETGDWSFLDADVPYYEKNAEGNPIESGTVLDHLRRALEFTRTHVGAHGLPLLGLADWNDAFNLPAGAESVFAAHLYGKALLEMVELSEHLGDAESAARYQADYEAMKQRVNDCAWDGEWYVRYFWNGLMLGSHANEYFRIDANAQSWSVISGFAPPERARAALDSVHRLLNTCNGIKLNAPAFPAYDPLMGGITTYPPGSKENGGIFLHANPWVIIAEALMGNGERAFEYYRRINPVLKNDCSEEYECEPYVYAQNICSDEHPQFGRARNSWLSGTASWAYQAATQYILGIRPTYNGLLIDPCIPKSWNGFRVIRRFRGAIYEIAVENPARVCRGVKSLSVDGAEIKGDVVPVMGEGESHRVDVLMGEPPAAGRETHG